MHPDPTKTEIKNMKIFRLTFSINCIRVTLSSEKAPAIFLMGIRWEKAWDPITDTAFGLIWIRIRNKFKLDPPHGI